MDAAELLRWLDRRVPATVSVFDLGDQRTVYSRRSLAELLGHPPDSSLPDLLDLVHPDDRGVILGALTMVRRLEDGELQSCRARFRRADGSPVWIESWISPFERDSDGAVRRVAGLHWLLSSRQGAIDALAQSQANLSALVENTHDPVFSVDREERLLVSNAAFRRLFAGAFGIEPQTGMPLRDVLPEKQRHAWVDRVRRALAGERFLVAEHYVIDGKRLEVDTAYNPIVTPDGAVAGIAVQSRDVTERSRMQATLNEAENRFRMLAERALDVVAVYRVKPEPKQEYVSPSAERLTGYAPAEFYDDPELWFRMVHPEDSEVLFRALTARGNEPLTSITHRIVRRDGSTAWVELSAVPIRDENGEVVAIESISRDVTDKVRLEDQLRQSQKLEAVGRLAGGIAHDFNNLLGIVLGNVELLRRSAPDGPEAREALEGIDDAAQRGAALTRQLLAFSRPQIARPRVLDLNEVVAGMRSMLRRLLPEHIRVGVELSSEGAPVRSDMAHIEQLVLNLAVNARDAMQAGGTLSIETEALPSPSQLVVGASQRVFGPIPRGPVIVLRVSDSGSGMDAAVLARAFDPFFSTKDRGSGLGLSIVYGIVKESGGCLIVQSAPGAGTRIAVVLPRAEEQPMSAQPRTSAPPSSARAGTVLLVEDEPQLRRLARLILVAEGYRVLDAGGPSEALALARAAPEPIDLLVTDLVMPEMNGRMLAAELVAMQPSLKVLYMTGYDDDMVTDQDPEQVQGVVLSKPFSADQLLELVANALRRPNVEVASA